jgi:hypothetical protein
MALSVHFLTSSLSLAITPLERWQAARRFGSTFVDRRWLVMLAVGVLIILVLLLLLVSVRRVAQERNAAGRLFFRYAQKRGLSSRESHILLEVAGKAGLRRSSAVFTMSNAFDRGTTRLLQETLAQHGAEENEQLRSELSFLREKLGFRKRLLRSARSSAQSKKASSRQIPAGRKISMTRRKSADDAGEIEFIVMENKLAELTVKAAQSIKVTLGEYWRVRYLFGTSIWEFDTTVISCHGSVLVLNHSDNVRFINRRRFLRVPVNKRAFVAHFPFAKMPASLSDRDKLGSPTEQGFAIASDDSPGPPEFVPAVATELAGPGLRLETSLDVKAGDRVLVVLQLGVEPSGSSGPGRGRNKPVRPQIVEGIGEVRHTAAAENGLMIAVELTGLSDSDVNELIRITNLASLRAKGEDGSTAGSAEAVTAELAPVHGS